MVPVGDAELVLVDEAVPLDVAGDDLVEVIVFV